MSQASTHAAPFVLLTNHGQALIAIAEDPDVRLREVAQRLGITERAVQSIVNDLVAAGYVQRTRIGRRNRYSVDANKPFPHPALAQRVVGSLLSGLVQWKQGGDPSPAAADTDAAPADALPPSSCPGEVETDEGLDRLTALAGWLLHAPISFVSMVNDHAEVITSGVGVPDALMRRELPLGRSICRHVVAAAAPLVIFDAAQDPLVRDNPAVTEFGLRAYVGLPLISGDGAPFGTLCVADTTPRRWSQSDVRMLTSLAAAAASQVEVQIVGRLHREAAERNRVLLDSLPETLILVFDRELRLEMASGAALARGGRDPQEMIGRTLAEVVAPEQLDELRRHYQAGLEGQAHEFVHEAGEHTYTVEVVPLRDGQGEVSGVMAVGREHLGIGRHDKWDVDRLRALIENVPGAIYRCSAASEWRMEFISEQIEGITGYPAAEFIDSSVRSFASVIHPDDRAMVERTVAEAVEADRPFIIEYRIVVAGGGTRWVREQGRGIRDEQGAVCYLDGAIFASDEAARRLAA